MRMTIAGRPVGGDSPLFVIAEIGLNHGGSVRDALALVDAAAHAGASAVKLQSLRGETLVAASCPPPAHVECESLREFFGVFELDESAHASVAARARERGLAFMSTPFDLDAVDMLVRLGCDAIKIASGDLTHHALIARAAATGLPLVISTGMSELEEVRAAVACARDAGARDIALLHCVSAYPVPAGSQNLRAIATLAAEFGVPAGLSDHGTDPLDIAVAVALGASLYEKHIVLDGDRGAIDAAVSATGRQLQVLVRSAERARRALGDGRRTCLPAEQPNRIPSRRGLYAARPLEPGEIVSPSDVVALRPAEGLGAEHWRALQGVRLTRRVAMGAPFAESDLDVRAGGLPPKGGRHASHPTCGVRLQAEEAAPEAESDSCDAA
jgi:sialic acid synthase SpsE